MGILTILFSSILLLNVVNAHWNCAGGTYVGGGAVPCAQSTCSQQTTCLPAASPSCAPCPTACPPLQVFSGGQCQMPAQSCQYTCQPGYTMISGVCQYQAQQPCTQQCTSSIGYQIPCQTQVCCHQPPTPVCVTPTTQPTVTTTTPFVCPPGYQMINNQCVKIKTEPFVCPPGYQMINNQCVKITTEPFVCPPGYQMINNQCVKITTDCPPGTVPHGDKCVDIKCPKETSWDGAKCHNTNSVKTDTTIHINPFITNKNEITNPTNVNVNNNNSVVIYTGGEKGVHVKEVKPEVVVTKTESTSAPQCCTIVTPRMCSKISKKWTCYNRKYQRCGSFCTSPKIYLKPVRAIQRQSIMVVPPRISVMPCIGAGCVSSEANCSGCVSGEQCSPYCSDYNCYGAGCSFQDQQSYCTTYSGESGCFESDGCYEDWCSH